MYENLDRVKRKDASEQFNSINVLTHQGLAAQCLPSTARIVQHFSFSLYARYIAATLPNLSNPHRVERLNPAKHPFRQ